MPTAETPAGLSPTVMAVYERILREVLSGERRAGSVVRDAVIARELGVSRTPVREALQMLRGIGVIEVLPSRFTRVAVLGLEDVARAGAVSLALYARVVEEVAAGGGPVPIAELDAEQAAARASVDEPRTFFAHCFRLGDLVIGLSENPHLRRALDAVDHALHLALISNADGVDLERVLDGQQRIIDGLRGGDPVLARDGVDSLRGLGGGLRLPSTR